MFVVAVVAFHARAAGSGQAYEVSDSDRSFLSAVVAAVDNKDARWIASHTMLPMAVNTSTSRKLVRTESELATLVASLLTDERRSVIQNAATHPLFKNWRGVMAGDGVLWFEEVQTDAGGPRFLITAFGGFAFQPADQQVEAGSERARQIGLSTSESEKVPVAPSFKIHGRLSVYNGNPGCRIWIVGTKRILGVAESDPPEVSFMPEGLRQILATDNLIFADFTVVPLTKDEPGVMRMVKVTAAQNVVITDGQLKFLRRVPGRIEE